MAEEVLGSAKVHALRGHVITTRVPKHVGVDVAKTGGLARLGDQVISVLARHRRAALGNEELWGRRFAVCQILLDGAQLVARDWVLGRQRALGTFDPYAVPLKI
jgi:hypothetical protein